MASFSKRYQDKAQSPADKSAPAVASTPVAAEPPPVAADAKPTEDLTTKKPSPAEQAAQNALKQRIAEMDRAESLQSEAVQHHQRLAAEPQQPQPQQQQQPTVEEVVANMPERARRWYKARPELFTDPEGAAHLQYAHWVAKRETGEELTDRYFDRMNQLLGFRQLKEPKPSSNGHSHARPPENNQANGTQAPPREPVRQQQQRPGPSVSAPPTRSAPSMTTGRPVSHRPQLTAEQLALAESLKISPQEYALQLEKMQRLKAAGAIQG